MRAVKQATLAVAVAAGTALVPLSADAQTLAAAPIIAQITEGTTTLTVFWDAPTVADGITITAYDLRHIASDAADKADQHWTVLDDFWTSGATSGSISSLTNGTQYDVQMRTVTGAGDGAWSGTTTATPRTSAPTISTLQAGDQAMTVVWTPPTEVASETGVTYDVRWIASSVVNKVDGAWSSTTGIDATSRIIRSLSNTTGYDVQVRAVTDHAGQWSTSSRATPYEPQEARSTSRPEIAIDVPFAGWLGTTSDLDTLRFTLSAQTHVLFHTSGDINDSECWLYGDSDNSIVYADNGLLLSRQRHCVGQKVLDAGTYYLIVRGRRHRGSSQSTADNIGAYVLHLETVAAPVTTRSDARPFAVGELVAAKLPANGTGYFQFVPSQSAPYDILGYRSVLPGDFELEVLDSDGNSVPASQSANLVCLWVDRILTCGTYGPLVSVQLQAGSTYFVKAEADSNGALFYIEAAVDFYYAALLSRCRAATRPAGVDDELAGCQWHLADANVHAAHSAGYLGSGAPVAVVDTGADPQHEDLKDNVTAGQSYTWCSDGAAYDTSRDHGTEVAGLVAAKNNSIGMRGVAPAAPLHSLRLLLCGAFTIRDWALAWTRSVAGIAAYVNSWSRAGDDAAHKALPAIVRRAMDRGLRVGFNDKGTLYVFSAGNNHQGDGMATLDETRSHPGAVTVCAVNDNGIRSVYSERGPNLWVCAPSDDRPGTAGIGTTMNHDLYTTSFGGTSAAAPIGGGVVALVRGENAALSWRDVKLILAASAQRNHSSDSGWQRGALEYGSQTEYYWFNDSYGFGLVDAHAAASLAAGWEPVPALLSTTASSSTELDIPNTASVESSTVSVGDDIEFVEHVEVTTNFAAPSFRELRVELVSPSGSVSRFADVASLSTRQTKKYALNGTFRFGSSRHLGENPEGTWTLRVSDRVQDATSTASAQKLKSWSINVRGHRLRPTAPELTSITSGASSLTVAWSAPDHVGASAITGYDVRHIVSTGQTGVDSAWTVIDDVCTAAPCAYAITGLTAVERHVQVRAKNSRATGSWSTTVTGTPAASNSEPFFGVAQLTRTVAEDATVGSSVGNAVSATDADADATLTYALSGTNASHFSINTGTGQISTAAALDHEGQEVYDLTVTVSDGLDSADNADTSVDASVGVQITVTDVDEPFSITGYAQQSLAEPTATMQTPNLEIGSYGIDDPEGEPAAWSLTGNDAAQFEIDTNGTLSFLNTPDHEEPADANDDNGYEVTINAAAGAHTDALDVTVTVTDIDEPPQINGRTSHSVDENSSAVLGQYVGVDPEGEAVTLTLTGTDRGDFSLAADGSLSFAAPPDYEAPADANRDNAYKITISGTDGPHTVTVEVTVEVADVNESPTLIDRNCTFTVAENSSGRWQCQFEAVDPDRKQFVWSLSGLDAARFEFISASTSTNGVSRPTLRTVSGPAFDHERTSSYDVTVEATDHGGLIARRDVTLTVTDLDERGSLTHTAAAREGVAIEATLSDPDGGGPSGVSWQWQRQQQGSWQDVSAATSGSYTPTIDDNGLRLRVTASYTDGPFGTEILTSSPTNAVIPAVKPNSPPEFSVAALTCEADENRRAGTLARCAARASDADADPLEYGLIDDSGLFAVNSGSGAISLVGSLDYETSPSHSLTLTVTDGSTPVNLNVTVDVIDVDEEGTVTVELPAEGLKVGATLAPSLDDDDCASAVCDVHWRWERSDNGREWAIIADETSGTLQLDETEACKFVQVRATYADAHRDQQVFAAAGSPAGTPRVRVEPLSGECGALGTSPTTTSPTPGGGGFGGGGGSGGGGSGGGGFDVGVATFVVANGWSAADVGVASVLAARSELAVVLYSGGDSLPAEAAVLLREALPVEVVIVGGTSAVPSGVRSAIRAASADSGLSRVSGADRFETAAAAARRVLGAALDAGSVTVVVANGWSAPDIGAAAALAARVGRSAVVYAEADRLPDASAAVLRDYEVGRVIVVGGAAAVSRGVQDRIGALAGGAAVTRLTGADRVDTAARAARRVLGSPLGAPEGVTLVIANGWSAPDVGVAAALAAATDNAAVAFVAQDSLPSPTAALIRDYRPQHVIIVGGRAALTPAVRTALADALGATDRTGTTIRRITGATRTQTAANAAHHTLNNN